MATDSIKATAGNLAGAGLGMDDLLKVMLTQLTYQDPLKPTDNQQFIAQIAQFSALQASNDLNTKVDTLLSIQSMTQSVGLLGKTVDAMTDTAQYTGQITAMTLDQGSPLLTLKTATGDLINNISLSQIVTVR